MLQSNLAYSSRNEQSSLYVSKMFKPMLKPDPELLGHGNSASLFWSSTFVTDTVANLIYSLAVVMSIYTRNISVKVDLNI